VLVRISRFVHANYGNRLRALETSTSHVGTAGSVGGMHRLFLRCTVVCLALERPAEVLRVVLRELLGHNQSLVGRDSSHCCVSGC
jgi:hypothetical protein